MLVQGKQINQLFGQSNWNTTGVAIPSGSSVDVTSLFSGKVSGGSDTQVGVYTSAPQNKVYIRLKSTGKAIEDSQHRQVFARLSFSSNVWTLTFYVIDAGSETTYDFSTDSNPEIGNDFSFRYCETVQMSNVAPTSVVNQGENIDELSVALHSHTEETLAVTSAGQTAFTLSAIPKDDNDVRLFVNGMLTQNGVDFTMSGTSLTWNDNDFTLDTTDIVIAYYEVN